jgi:phosphoglycolate phosphatase
MTALVFDLDGTLVDTAPDLADATNVVLAARGRPPVALSSLRAMVGHGARALILKAFAATGEPAAEAELPELYQLFIAHYRQNIARASRPFPGVPETLALLKARGTKMGVLTNKPDDLAKLLLKTLDLTGYFGFVLGAGVRAYAKPDARCFADVLSGLDAAHGIMVGDSVTDVLTARAANAPAIIVSYGYTVEPASTLGADVVIDEFEEVPDAAVKFGLRS